jgi:hypothetical protein
MSRGRSAERRTRAVLHFWNSLPVGSVEEARGQEQALRAACTGRRTPSHRTGSDAVRIWRGGVDYDDPQGSPVVGARSTPGNSYDEHTLADALKQVAILSDVCPEVAILDYGYKGIAIDDVKIPRWLEITHYTLNTRCSDGVARSSGASII